MAIRKKINIPHISRGLQLSQVKISLERVYLTLVDNSDTLHFLFVPVIEENPFV